MANDKTCVLSIAGFDPSGGAGVLADIKTFEAHKVQGMAVLTALTFQNDMGFEGVKWIATEDIIRQVEVLSKRFVFSVVKIGLIKNLETLEAIIAYLNSQIPNVKLIWDPIIKASAGFEFHRHFERDRLQPILRNITLITPNTEEVNFLTENCNYLEESKAMARYCNVLLKGGHNKQEPGVDHLFSESKIEKFYPLGEKVFPKHGSGCILSAAIASNLAKGNDMFSSCRKAKGYVEKYLSGNASLLGFHYEEFQ